jgi:zinc D-Ala-D-Ala carboxypeptidase
MRKRLAMAALTTLALPAALLTAAAAPADAAPASNTCQAVNFIGMYCGYYAGSETVAEYSSYTSAVKEIQDLIDRESNFPGTKLAVDGSFGPLTFSAVEWLQSHDHICGGVDGVVGSCTWAYLRG